MVKIGRCYFNEAQIAAIEPNHRGAFARVYLVRGAVISVDVHEEDLQGLLERAGLLHTAGEPVTMLEFTVAEHDALWRAWEDGYLFVAKDISGQVYAYANRPTKHKQTWIDDDDDEGLAPRRLPGDYVALSFEDDEPLDLLALFSEGIEEDEEE